MKTVLVWTILVLALASVGVLAAIGWIRGAPQPGLLSVPEFEEAAHYPREHRPLRPGNYAPKGLWDEADLPRDAFGELGPLAASAGSDAEPGPAPGRTWRLVAVGDVMAHADVQVGAALHRHDPGETSGGYDWIFAEVAPLFVGADLVLGNLETPVSPSRPPAGYPHFNADPFLLDALARLGFDVLFTANNHALDQGVDGLVETQQQLEQRGLLHLGTHRPDRDVRDHLLVSVGGAPALVLGLVNVTLAVNPAPDDPRLLEWPPPGTDPGQAIGRRIRAARDAGAEAVLVFLHWGREYHVIPTPAQRELARALCLAGADVILGAGPHVSQPMERLHTRDGEWLDAPAPGAREHFVAYSLGNFVSHQRGAAQYGLALELEIEAVRAPGEAGIRVRSATPRVLQSVMLREQWPGGEPGSDHHTFRLRELPLTEFLEALR